MNSELIAASLLDLLAAVTFAYVAVRFLGRPVSSTARFATWEFAAYWIGQALTAVVAGLSLPLAAWGLYGFDTTLTLYLFSLLIDTLVLAGLVGYLVYVYTGRYHLAPLAAVYSLFYLAVLNYVVSEHATGVKLVGGSPTLVYAVMPTGIVVAFIVIILIFPELIAALAYLSLIRLARGREQRYRILLVTASILTWYISSLFLPNATGPAPNAWSVVHPALSLVSSLLGLVAFFPPRPIQAWLGPSAPAAGPAEERPVPAVSGAD